ncbi:MAG: SDR family oxidoreductase [Nannocystaceae bacterium]
MSRAPARVYVLGADGMLGRAWLQQLRAGGIEHRGFALPQFDLTRAADLDALPLQPGDAVLNCAAWTDVDGAEKDEATATRVNGSAVGQLAQRCADAGASLVHYSTDYVFDGQASVPYPVDGMHAPLSAYGRSKAVGEPGVRGGAVVPAGAHQRWLYAPWGRTSSGAPSRSSRASGSTCAWSTTSAVARPAPSIWCARWRLLGAGVRGIVHVTDGEQCTWFEFASAIAAAVAPQCRVDPCTTAEFPRPARRPGYSVLDLARTEAAIGAMPPWRDNLADVLARLE